MRTNDRGQRRIDSNVHLDSEASRPLAPTKLTLFPDLEHGRQGGAESKFDRFGRELVFHPLEALDVRAREQRRCQSLASIRSRVRLERRQRPQVGDDLG